MSIVLADELTVMVAMSPIDMRCGINRLVLQVADTLQASPQSKTLFLFYNRARTAVKGLLWDSNGFLLLHKRLQRGHFCFPKQFDRATLQISHAQLQGLLAGFDFIRMNEYPGIDFSYYF